MTWAISRERLRLKVTRLLAAGRLAWNLARSWIVLRKLAARERALLRGLSDGLERQGLEAENRAPWLKLLRHPPPLPYSLQTIQRPSSRFHSILRLLPPALTVSPWWKAKNGILLLREACALIFGSRRIQNGWRSSYSRRVS